MPANSNPFSSLLKVANAKIQDRWYPTSVDTYKLSFDLDMSIENISTPNELKKGK